MYDHSDLLDQLGSFSESKQGNIWDTRGAEPEPMDCWCGRAGAAALNKYFTLRCEEVGKVANDARTKTKLTKHGHRIRSHRPRLKA